MNTRAMRAIMRKDLIVVLRSPAVMIPLIIVPAVMLLALPLLVGLIPRLDPSSVGGLDRLIAGLPPSIAEQVAGMDEVQTAVYVALIYLFAPLYLIVPLMVASVIAADSFAGEKERGTLEALLYAPLTDRELFAAKMLTAQVPAVIVAWGGALLYGVVANWVGWQILGHRLFPNLMWTILALWVAPAGAGLGLGVTALVSARARSFQEAYQVGAVVVVPIVALVIAQAAGVMYLSPALVFALGLIFWAIDIALLNLGGRLFQRTQVLLRL